MGLAITCVASLDREAWQEIAKNKDYQYGIWGKYSKYKDSLKIEFILLDIENGQIVNSKETIVSLEQLTERASELLIALISSIHTDVTDEQIQRVKFPETSNIAALKNNALGFWTQQIYLNLDNNTEKEILENPWKEHLLHATKADPTYANASNNLGWHYLIGGNQEEAKQAFEYTLGINPNHPDSLDGLASIHQSQNDLNNASMMLKKLTSVSPSFPLLSFKLANLYMKMEEYAKADSSYRNALNPKRKIQGFEYSHVNNLYYLAELNLSQNNFLETIFYTEQALAIQEKVLGADHIEVAKSLNRLAAIYMQSGKFTEAKPLLERALAIQERNYGSEHADVAQSLTLLVFIHMKLGDLATAKSITERALSIQEKIYGPDHANVGRSVNILGAIHLVLGDYAYAKQFLERSLAIQKEIHGSEHVDVAQKYLNLGIANQALGNFDQAKANFERSLEIYEKLLGSEHELVAKSLDKVARMHFVLGDSIRAKKYYERALAINEKVHGQESAVVANNLRELANIHKSFDDFEQAEKLYRFTLSIDDKIYGSDSKETIKSLQGLASLYLSVDDYAQAKPLLERASAILEKNIHSEYSNLPSIIFAHFEPIDSILILADLGDLYIHLGDYEKARQLLSPLLPEINKIFGDAHIYTTPILVRVASLYMILGDYAQAKSLIEYALASQEQTFGLNDSAVAVSLAYLGEVHFHLNENSEAKTLFERALEITEKNNGLAHSTVAYRLNELAVVHIRLGEYELALQHLKRALLIAQSAHKPLLLASTQGNLRELYVKLQKPEEAIFFGKLAINTLQTHRGRLTNLEENLQKSFLNRLNFHYHNLAEILIEQGRLAEAEQVMAMLKEEEYFDFIQRDGKGDMRTTQAGYTQVESGIVRQIDQFSDQLVLLGKEYENLTQLSQIDEQAKIRLTEVEKELEKAQDGFLNLLSSLDEYFKQAGSDQALEFGERQLTQLERQQGLLRKHQAVIITTVATKDKLHLILTTPEVQLARESAITERDLNDLIKRFRNALKHPGSNPVPLAQELYDHLVKPLEKDLQQAQAKTLMWSLDGALRYVPLATLHDGQQYLIEKYGLSLYTAAAQNNLHENNVGAWRAAGLGVSLAHPGFVELPSVPNELRNIIRQNDNDQMGVLPGEIHLDQAFNRESFKSVIRAGYPVLHIASHFKLQPGNGSLSTLLLGDGDLLSLDEFRRQAAFKLHGVDLLTLSACDTAVGDKGTGGEVESFAVMAQLRGANGVLASLWRVEDESTGLLMKWLYRLRSENTQLSKAEALRQAQVAMLSGDLQARESGHDFRHPYFWAPFVMMGNWL